MQQPISHCKFNRGWVKKLQASDFPLPGWISSEVFACHMSYVILTDIIQTVLETSECFVSKSTNCMHSFYGRVAGSLIWACVSSIIPNAAPYPREVKQWQECVCKVQTDPMNHCISVLFFLNQDCPNVPNLLIKNNSCSKLCTLLKQ